MEKFLKELGINGELERGRGGVYVLNIKDSTEFGKIYTKLDSSNLLDEVDESSQVTADVLSVQYVNEEYTITLLGDLVADVYSLTIRRN